MSQDVDLGITGSVTQADLAPLREAARLGEYALVYRIERLHQGGGYGDQGKHPLAWAVAVYVDNQLCRVFNARGAGREWNSIDRLSTWLPEAQGLEDSLRLIAVEDDQRESTIELIMDSEAGKAIAFLKEEQEV